MVMHRFVLCRGDDVLRKQASGMLFQVGIPAKSGVSGAMLVVIPNVMGICTWSPPLDPFGNSCRGLSFCEVNSLHIHCSLGLAILLRVNCIGSSKAIHLFDPISMPSQCIPPSLIFLVEYFPSY